ncbi:exosome complex component RRP43 [Copidosoma floridanum]|uniref:exosome complex component RRP43 n=1 Tax=Copidosoma floridanum TaxID=29053 RepID=UPI0006C97F12|nr:exosome complex component RRP43 [Copidosoma floridanum]
MESQYKTIHPAKYLRDHFASNIRPDGRDFTTFRPVSLNIGSITQADSSAVIKIGNTAVVCGIKAELATPKAEAPDCGFVIPNVELTPLSSPKFRPGPPGEEAQHTTKLVERILLNSEAIDLKDLCICKDKLVWVLYCDLICVDYDGSVVDACIGVLMAALKTLTLPVVEYTPETGATKVDPNNRISIPLRQLAVSSTYAIFEDQLLVVDPTEDEESLSLSTLTIVCTEIDMCFMHKSGGVPISINLLNKCISKARSHGKKVRKLILAAVSTITDDVG